MQKQIDNPTIKGSQYRQSHVNSVNAILGSDSRPVISRGSRFYNYDRWTVRVFTSQMCTWAANNPGCVPTKDDVKDWVNASNREHVPKPAIVIANTPENLGIRTALALTGGAYHEALHTHLSCRRRITADEMFKIVVPRWAKIANWAPIHEVLQEWSNVIEDIRIERCGIQEFPGIKTKMHDLQDFILEQEEAGFLGVRTHAIENGNKPQDVKRGPFTIISAAFRDRGLGYKTETQKSVWKDYLKENPEAVKIVIEGPLRPLLKEAIHLGPGNDTGCLAIAMDILVELVKQSKQEQQEKQAKTGQPGDGEQTCPSCGGPAYQIIVRPKSDGMGGKVKGVGIATCTACGHQVEVQIDTKKKQDNQIEDAGKTPGPKFEGFDLEDFEQDSSQDPKDTEESSEGGSSVEVDDPEASSDKEDSAEEEKGGSGSKEKGDPSDEGEDTDSKEDRDSPSEEGEGSDSSKGDPTESSAEGDPDPFEEDGSESAPDKGKGKGNPNLSEEKGESDKESSSNEGSSLSSSWDGELEGKDWSHVADEAIGQAGKEKTTGLLDDNKALEDVFSEAITVEEGTLLDNEFPYRPFDPTLDEARIVKPSKKGVAWDRNQAQYILSSVQGECSYLRSRLASLIRALEQTDIIHGVRKGRDLSEQYLVDSALAVRSGVMPTRAYYEVDAKIDTSMAAAIVLDESGSMGGATNYQGQNVPQTEIATRIMVALTEPLDRLGVAVMATGFRHGVSSRKFITEDEGSQMYHRYGGIITDVFKTFDERFSDVMWRFANTRASGGTPMADGIQFGLDALNFRDEAHRVLFIVTDGQPTSGHEVIPWQLRIAKEAGIHIIGVGIGDAARYVRTLFPDHVWTNKMDEFPILLLTKLNELIDIRVATRGRRIQTQTF